ncbi:MAG: fibronectin type III domain-containing protein [Eggerthellaceae bacterium]|jgi:hypothetical protein
MDQTRTAVFTGGIAAALLAVFLMLGSGQAFAAGSDFGDAQGMTPGKTYSGYLKSMEGPQYYFFKTLGKKGVTYRIKASNSNTDALWGQLALTVTVWDKANSRQVKRFSVVAHSSDSVALKGLKPQKKYYVIVQSEGGTLNYYNENYTVRCTYKVIKPAKAKISTLKASSGKVKVTYGKVRYADRYQVAYKKKGASAWKIANNGTKRSKTIKSLKKGKKYTVKVRAQRTVSGKTYSGAWSAAKRITVKY